MTFRLVSRARTDGDLTMMIALLLRPIPGLRAELSQRSVDRYLALMLEGLRARQDAHPLPDREITIADLGGT